MAELYVKVGYSSKRIHNRIKIIVYLVYQSTILWGQLDQGLEEIFSIQLGNRLREERDNFLISFLKVSVTITWIQRRGS
mgnify:CR=1 FL=1